MVFGTLEKSLFNSKLFISSPFAFFLFTKWHASAMFLFLAWSPTVCQSRLIPNQAACREWTTTCPVNVSRCITHEFHWHLWMLTIIFQLEQWIRTVPWWLPRIGMSQWWMWDRNCHTNYTRQIDLTMNRWKCEGCTLNHVLLAFNLILFSPAAIEGLITNVWPDPPHYVLTNVRAKCFGVNLWELRLHYDSSYSFLKNFYSCSLTVPRV